MILQPALVSLLALLNTSNTCGVKRGDLSGGYYSEGRVLEELVRSLGSRVKGTICVLVRVLQRKIPMRARSLL